MSAHLNNPLLCPRAGGQLALLFEDLLKRINADLRKQAEAVLAKPTRAT